MTLARTAPVAPARAFPQGVNSREGAGIIKIYVDVGVFLVDVVKTKKNSKCWN